MKVFQVEIPGSKSYTNRALFIASLVGYQVKILNPLISDDTKAMISCLKALKMSGNLNARLSGTTLRFLLALSAVSPGIQTIFGGEGLNKRPVGDLVSALTQLGAKIEYLGKKGYPPVRVFSSKLNPGTIKMKGTISSQFISAILMVAPLIGDISIEIIGNQISKPYIDMTIDIMKHFGVKVSNTNYKNYHVKNNQKYIAKKYLVEGDLSSAAYFLAVAALTKSTIFLKNINPNSKQADMKFVKILESMGNKIVYGKNSITITGKGIKSMNVDMSDCPDQIQTMAVLVAFANGISKISGISSLRIKETDRVFALRQELKKMGIKTSATKNVLTINGGNPKAATIETYGDHRMAMSFAVAGVKISGMRISSPDVVNKTFPDFFEKLNSIKNIVLIGMRGSGKTTVAKMLSKKLNKPYLELDEILAKQMRMSISQIVEKFGWEFFRDKESEIVKQTSKSSGVIISTGGGVVTRPENIEVLRKNGILIYLNTPLKTLIERMGREIGENPKMPALTDKKDPKAEIAYVLSQREKLYKQAAHKIFLTGSLKTDQIVDKIIASIKEKI